MRETGGVNIMLIRCEYTPRGKSGSPLCPALKFTGTLLRRAIEEGRYIVRIESTVYAVQIQDMNEIGYTFEYK